MKINEIMIEDWVSLFQGNPDGSSCNVQVTFVGEYGEVGIEGCGEYTSANCHLLFPIPITTEILDKNFNSAQIPDDPYGALFFYSNDYIEVYIKEYSDGLWQVQVDEVEMGGLPSWLMYVSNAHELQHALRLCGIEKEIII